MITLILGIFAGFIAVGSAIYQYREKIESDKKAEKSEQEAKEFNTKLIASQQDLIVAQAKNAAELREANDRILNSQIELTKRNETIIELNNRLNSKSDNIIESNEKLIAAQGETIKQILGDGYPVLHLFPREGKLFVLFENNSNYSLHDGYFEIVDNQKLTKECIVKETTTEIDYKAVCFERAILGSGEFSMIPHSTKKLNLPLDPDQPICLIIRTTFKHATFFQYLFFDNRGDDLATGGLNGKSVIVWQLYQFIEREKSWKLLEEKNNTKQATSILSQLLPVTKIATIVHGLD